jgi:hypothetical protein
VSCVALARARCLGELRQPFPMQISKQ